MKRGKYMSLFNKNPNETAYTGNKKHWTDVIKNSGPGELLIWRQPEEDFNTNSTLIVMPGEEAVFIKDGKIEQVFKNGTYKLSTKNYPFISRLINAFSGGISTFNCVVYFVRKADSKEIRWGTETPIQVRDKVWGVRTEARVRGAYKVRIENPVQFLEKLIGNNILFQLQEELDEFFASEFQGKIKTTVSKFLNSLEQELIGIDSYIDELSEKIMPSIDKIVSDYGLRCVKFSLAGLDVDTTKYDAIDASQINLIARKRDYQGDKSGLDILGNDWEKVQVFGSFKDLANNPASGGVAAAGAGIGLGVGAANIFDSLTQQMSASAIDTVNQENSVPVSNQSREDSLNSLKSLKKMLDEELISQEDYNTKKAEILSRM